MTKTEYLAKLKIDFYSSFVYRDKSHINRLKLINPEDLFKWLEEKLINHLKSEDTMIIIGRKNMKVIYGNTIKIS